MKELAFLSVRVSDETKRLVKEIAARKGVTIQNLVRRLVDDLIEEETRDRPSLAGIVNMLRNERKRLENTASLTSICLGPSFETTPTRRVTSILR